MMSHENIATLIGKAIREGKYLQITYKNRSGEVSLFWISILDINARDELRVNMFNVTKDDPIRDGKIFISGIQSAEILRFSYYDVPASLIKKLEHDESLHLYDANRYDKILNYYLACYKANKDPFLHKAYLIPGIDITALADNNPYTLTDEQQKQVIKEIYHNDYSKYYEYELAISEFSIDLPSRGKFVVAYRRLMFDPVQKRLRLGNKTHFNANFYIEGVKQTLSYYADISPADFELLYKSNKSEAIELLRGNFRTGELPNTRPEVVVLGYAQIDIAEIYDIIHEDRHHDDMQIPLKAIFQNLSLLDRRNRKEPHIVLYDRHVNIDQLRTIYNALKYPITYVQGPPGTGKTQTILNIVVNCLVNNKTLLISSNNNVPIDGIREKLVLGKYKNKEILFPFIRLGNNACVAEALQTIKAFHDLETRDVPEEPKLFNLKEKSREKNKLLLEKLKRYEDRLDLLQNLGFIDDLLSKGNHYLLEKERQKLEARLSQIPEITNDDFIGIFEVIRDNPQLLQFFYYESLKYVKRLKEKKYNGLVDILAIEQVDQQVKEFNRWIANDENLQNFTKVFPIILTTNISSRRLGRQYKFDLLAMDEAGQCEIATSLIPISKCKNMVLIGDTNQLKPIVVFDETRNEQLMNQFAVDRVYDYYKNSILSVYKSIDNISRDILLSYHYRCGRKIINYSNMRFYENRLNLSMIKNPGKVELIDVNNINHKDRNSALEEAQEIVRYIAENKLTDVFIITPFRNQEAVLQHYLQKAKAEGYIDSTVNCGTIHKIQGQENKTIIISPSISRKTSSRTYDWIKNNSELINVGVTRAQENIVVVADKRAIDILSRRDDDLYALIDYVQQNGTTAIAPSTINRLTIGFSNDSRFEDEFYKTMSHYCTLEGARFERNVRVIDVFPEERNNPAVNKKEFDGVIYLRKDIQVIFEINGTEHYKNKKRIASDKTKLSLVEAKGLKLLFIPNQYVKHYEFIRELMIKVKGGVYQKSLFDI